MDTLVHVGLLNAVLAIGLALLAWAARLLRRRPAVVHAIWLLVLLKLITPPFLDIPIGWLPRAETTAPTQELTIQSAAGTLGHAEPVPPDGAPTTTDQALAQVSERPREEPQAPRGRANEGDR